MAARRWEERAIATEFAGFNPEVTVFPSKAFAMSPPVYTPEQSQLKRGSVLRCNGHAQAVEGICHLDLTRQAAIGFPMFAAVEQVDFVIVQRIDFAQPFVIHIDMAGAAGTRAATQRQQFIKAIVANIFHHGQAGFGIDFGFITATVGYNQLGHKALSDIELKIRIAIALPGSYSGRMTNQDLYDRFVAREPVPGWRVAVKTTGIYCRSGCPARTPKFENVSFYATADEARAAGYRACKRCNPDNNGPLGADEQALVVKAIRILEERTGTATQVAKALGISPLKLDRLVRRAVGVSLTMFDEHRRFGKLRQALPLAVTVTTAIYDSGFSGPRRVYEKGDEMLGMTPNRFKNGGKGERIGYAMAATVLGHLGVAATAKGVCFVCMRHKAEIVEDEMRKLFHAATLLPDTNVQATAEMIARSVNERQPLPDLPLDIQASAFEAQVWQALLAIPRGQTQSYGEIAHKIGNPKASRAVGRACGANPAALLIPCHRAIGADGKLTGFAWGLPAKARLLQDEGALLQMGHGTVL
jgi:AraC family transcriptional regulator, regulatory protein of adaptative response / methylated-DNA-[protein]-cysteine methyltransferase